MRYDLNPPYLELVAEIPTRRPVYVLLTDEDDQRNEDIKAYCLDVYKKSDNYNPDIPPVFLTKEEAKRINIKDLIRSYDN